VARAASVAAREAVRAPTAARPSVSPASAGQTHNTAEATAGQAENVLEAGDLTRSAASSARVTGVGSVRRPTRGGGLKRGRGQGHARGRGLACRTPSENCGGKRIDSNGTARRVWRAVARRGSATPGQGGFKLEVSFLRSQQEEANSIGAQMHLRWRRSNRRTHRS